MAVDIQKHLYDLISPFKTAMLVTQAGRSFHARPMAIAELKHDADAVFATSLESPKVAEIGADPHVLVTFQASSSFASIEGTASIVRDKAEIERLWSEAWKVWFPGGKDDPSLCLLRVRATAGEYWDNSGMQGLKYLFEGMKAVLQKRTPIEDQKQHAKVSL